MQDRYETRLRAMIDAKLHGDGSITETAKPVVSDSNVIDLVAVLRKSLAGTSQEEPTSAARNEPEKQKRAVSRKEPDRRQTGLKLPIAGGKAKATEAFAAKAPGGRAEPSAQPVSGRRKAS